MDFVEEQKFLPAQQFGFLKILSAVQQAGNFHVMVAPENGWTTIVAVLDWEKATS